MGYPYPAFCAALALLGHLTGIEYYLNVLNVLAAALALLVCDTARPLIPFAITLVYQVTREHTPGFPGFSDYYFTEWRLAVLVILCLLLFAALLCFAARRRIFSGLSLGTPLLLPLLALSLGFVFGGAFSEGWDGRNLVFGVTQMACYGILFIFLYQGLRGERASELLDYLTFSSAATAALLLGEMLGLYLGEGCPIVDGVIVKEMINFGWGVMNTMGLCLSVLIPMCFLGYRRSRHPIPYIVLGVLCYVGVLLTLSRNGIIAGGLALVASLVLSAASGEKKRRIGALAVLIVGAVSVLALAVVFREKIALLFKDIFDRGLSDNGRFDLWRQGIGNFLSSPIFGVGFFRSYGIEWITAEFLPDMPHQTFITLLAATGVFGTAAYIYYRVETLRLLFKRVSTERLFLALSILVLLLESLVDNFIFYYLPILHYTATLAVVGVMNDAPKDEGVWQ